MKPVRVVKRRNRAVLLALLVIVCAVAIVFLYTLWTNHVWSREIYQLKHKASNLYSVIEHQRNEFRELQNALGESNSSLLNNEKGNITFLEKIAALQDEMTEMRSDMHQMRTKVDSVKSYAENTYQGLNNLGERFEKYIRDSRVVNLADHCSTETEQCSVPSSSNQGKYWKSCRTVKVGLNIPEKITLDYRCSFHSSSMFNEYHESLTPQEDGNSVWCDCDVTFPGDSSDRQRSIAADYTGTCYLTIVRCSSSF